MKSYFNKVVAKKFLVKLGIEINVATFFLKKGGALSLQRSHKLNLSV
jgi:hypothetical protein